MKKAKLFMMLALLIMGVSSVFAQHVTVTPSTGSLIAALTSGSEEGFEKGWSAMWRHEQLPLTFTVADDTLKTDAGEIANPAGNINTSNNGANLIVAGGTASDLYCVLSLPKGYRITGYKMVLLNNLNSTTIKELRTGSVSKTMYETDNTYNTSSAKAQSSAMGGTNSSTTEFVVERTSQNDEDMGNQIYFRLTGGNNYRSFYAVTIKSFDVYFTAEGTFEADVTPEEIGQARSVVTAPFQTSKIDIGQLQVQEKNGQRYFAYNYQNVRDLTGYNFIYQSNAVQNGVPAEGEETKTIYPVHVDGKDLFAFGNNTYYAEPPIQVHTQSGLEAPVGYRIVGARFNYLWGTSTQGGTQTRNSCYITYTYNGTLYYLNDQLHFTTNKFAWQIDSNGNIYVTAGRYLSCGGNANNYRPISWSTEANGRYNLRRDTRGYIYYRTNNNNYFYLEFYDENGYVGPGVTPIMARNNYYNSGYLATSSYETETITIPAFTPGTYTLSVYDKTGNNIEKTVNVTQSNAGGIIELEDLNNDAVKFEISNLETGKQALVAVTLLLQALDPYMDNMKLVCHDPNDQFTLTQNFTADDFMVAGGSFKFYVPKSKKDDLLTISFKDLWSKYGDETYPEGSNSHFGRYSFVTSEYFTPINGNGNGGLYDNVYDPEAASDNKIVTSTAGNIRFKFNNAEDLGNTGTGTGYLEETPFSVAAYLGSEDPDNGSGSETGAFVNCQLKASSDTQKSGIYYVFTADETRYNIAPTTALQHRAYAFYRMDVELVAEDFTPVATPKEVYKKTFYTDESNNIQSKAMYGVKLTTDEKITVDDGNNGTKETYGYLSAAQVVKAIEALEACDEDQVLFVDGSELLSIVELGDTAISDLMDKYAKNVLVFLPENTTSTLDNFAYKTGSGSFRAGKDIVISDKQPFFTPYDIQVDAANYMVYDRALTPAEGYGNVVNATVILPFTLDMGTTGEYQSKDRNGNVGNPFKLATMKANEALEKEGKFDYGVGHFENITGMSEANAPYVVTVTSKQEGDYNFNVRATGSLVKATGDPYATGYDSADGGIFIGQSSTATVDGTSYSLTPTGSYMGKEIENASTANPAVFYFSKDHFVTTRTLDAGKSLKILPFRSYYEYNASAGAKLTKFRIVFGDYEGENSTTGINKVERNADLAVIPGKGIITLMARADKDVTIYAVSGMTVDKCNLKAGDTRTVTVPAGIYVINGVKMVVK